jgi:Flp pilus assembly protein TadD
MVSATPPPPPPPPPPSTPSEPETTPEEYHQRALLLADLGRYDEAAGEIAAGLGAAPADATLLATLARVHLAADQPAEALVAADRAVAAAPETIKPLVVRAMALADSRRFGEAAQVATGILRHWPEDPYAQRTGAALLSEARNGQEALNAAWHAVRVAPTEAEAHLVLAVVAARLRLYDLAQRAYAEALDLDEAIGDAQADVGVVRLERRRWAQALERLADDAVFEPPPPTTQPPGDGGYPSPFPRPYQLPDPSGSMPAADPTPGGAAASKGGVAGSKGGVAGSKPGGGRRSGNGSSVGGTGGGHGWFAQPAVSRPTGPVLDPSADSADGVRQAVLYSANGTLVVGALTAGMTLVSPGIARVWAGMIGVLTLAATLVWLSRRLTEPTSRALARLRVSDRSLAVAAYGALAAPLAIVAYAVIGGLAPLVTAMIAAAAAELVALLTRRR